MAGSAIISGAGWGIGVASQCRVATLEIMLSRCTRIVSTRQQPGTKVRRVEALLGISLQHQRKVRGFNGDGHGLSNDAQWA